MVICAACDKGFEIIKSFISKEQAELFRFELIYQRALLYNLTQSGSWKKNEVKQYVDRLLEHAEAGLIIQVIEGRKDDFTEMFGETNKNQIMAYLHAQ